MIRDSQASQDGWFWGRADGRATGNRTGPSRRTNAYRFPASAVLHELPSSAEQPHISTLKNIASLMIRWYT
jgi:hypothetical protein